MDKRLEKLSENFKKKFSLELEPTMLFQVLFEKSNENMRSWLKESIADSEVINLWKHMEQKYIGNELEEIEERLNVEPEIPVEEVIFDEPKKPLAKRKKK